MMRLSATNHRQEVEDLALDLLRQTLEPVDFDVPGFGGRHFASIAGRQSEDRQYLSRPLAACRT